MTGKHLFCLLVLVAAVSCKTSQITLSDPNSHIINVKLIGAKGDGISNDTQFFEEAISSLIATESLTELFIPPGKYLIDKLELSGLRGKSIRGSGMENTILISSGKSQLYFIKIGNKKGRREKNDSFQGGKITELSLYDRKIQVDVGLLMDNCQDNILEHVEIRGFKKALSLNHSWINSFRNIRIIGFKEVGVDIGNSAINANYFETVRNSCFYSENAICWNVGGNSTTFVNCTAEGDVESFIGWQFRNCRSAILTGCHSEGGNTFSISKISGVVTITNHFIWNPSQLFSKKNYEGRLNYIANLKMVNCYINSPKKELRIDIDAKEGNLNGLLPSYGTKLKYDLPEMWKGEIKQ